jgi:hypothetical protein
MIEEIAKIRLVEGPTPVTTFDQGGLPTGDRRR